MSRRRFEDLRPQRAEPREPADTIEKVLTRIGATHDGRIMLAWLADQNAAPHAPNASDAALREAEGARRAYDRLVEMARAD